MTTQKEVFLVFSMMFIIIVSVFFLVFISSKKSGEVQNPNRKRAIFFFIALGTVLLILGNLIADILLVVTDPRIKFS